MPSPQKPYILWVDYGTEGWMPVEFDTPQEAVLHICNGVSGPFVLTKLVRVSIEE